MMQPQRLQGRLVVLLILCLTLSATAAGETDRRLDIWGVYGFDDNISRSLIKGEQESDHSLRVEGTANWRCLAGANASAHFGLLAAAEHHFDFSDLSNVELGGRGEWRFRTGQGFSAPIYSVAVDLTGHLHDDSKIRDGGTMRATAGAESRLTDRLSVRGGYRYTLRRARSSSVFDNQRHGLFVGSELALAPTVVLNAVISWERGDVVANSTPIEEVIAVASALAFDDAFGASRFAGQLGPGPGPGPGPVAGPGESDRRVAYRLDADVWQFELGTRIRIDHNLTLDVNGGYLKVNSRASNLDYDGLQIVASLGYRL